MKRQLLARLGKNIREHRLKMGLSQEQLAARVGLHRTYIGGIERGERNISILNLARIAVALQIDLATLVKGVTETSDARKKTSEMQ